MRKKTQKKEGSCVEFHIGWATFGPLSCKEIGKQVGLFEIGEEEGASRASHVRRASFGLGKD